jgi:hypothetical protein
VLPLRPALILACAALAVPSALLAQQPITTHLPVHPSPVPPHARPTYRPGHGANPYRYGTAGILIDGSVVNRYLMTPAPHPTPARKPTPRPKGAPDVFEEHSSTDANP